MDERLVIVSDVHGQADAMRRIYGFYGDEVEYVRNGDDLDGPQVKELMEMTKDTDTRLLIGNHEWITVGALSDSSQTRRTAWQLSWVGHPTISRHERGTLASYGIPEYTQPEDTAKALYDELRRLGHWALLKAAETYYETDELLVIHAGLSRYDTWQNQRRQADGVQALAEGRMFTFEPPFLSSFEYAEDLARPPDLDKTLVTGHSHLSLSADERVTPGRVRLASKHWRGEPVFAYESWTGQVRAFDLAT